MSERDELALELFILDNSNQSRGASIADWKYFHAAGIEHFEIMADALLSTGYSKPRTINDVDELNALPVGSVVLSRGRSFQRYEPNQVGLYTYHLWQSADGGFIHTPEAAYIILPATVIYEPEAAL